MKLLIYEIADIWPIIFNPYKWKFQMVQPIRCSEGLSMEYVSSEEAG